MFDEFFAKLFAPFQKNTFNSIFDKVFVISLPEDIEERKLIAQYLNKYNIEFEFFDAVNGYNDPKIVQHYEDYLTWDFDNYKTHEIERRYQQKMIKSPGALGLLETYINLFEKLITCKNVKNVLIIEDDVIFDKNIDVKLQTLNKAIPKYDLLYLGASHHVWRNPEIIERENNTSYYKAPYVIDGSFAVAYNQSIFKPLLNNLKKRNAPVDLVLRDIVKNNNSYVAYPNIAIAETSRPSKTGFHKRNLRNHCSKVRWDLSNMDFSRGILKVSIIIASHNNKNTIQHAVDSALNQTYPNIEVIVIDDCSTDGSVEILKSYGNKIKLFKSRQNKGAYYCRNIGLDNASGFFVTLMDADDIMMSRKIETDVYNYYNNPNCEIFLSNIYRSQGIDKLDSIDDNTLQVKIDEERKPYLKPEENCLWGHNAPWDYKYRSGMQTIFLERDFFKKYGPWRNDFRYGMDIELIQRYVVKKYNKFIDHKTLFKLIYSYKTKDNLGIYLSPTMNYFSYPMNKNNATIACQGDDRQLIHHAVNKELVHMLSSMREKRDECKTNISHTKC